MPEDLSGPPLLDLLGGERPRDAVPEPGREVSWDRRSSRRSARRARRIGVMGGTFDPIHHGHLVAASEVASRFSLDEVVFVPTGVPWQKTERVVTAAEHRYLMTVVATAANPQFRVSRVDIDRGGLTYTIDTLADLAAQEPGAELFFITGADALAQILTWKDAERAFDLAQLVGVTRPDHDLDVRHLPQAMLARLHLLEVPALAISSTDVRERVAHHRPVWYLVPDGVVRYIDKHRLYRGGPTGPPPVEPG